MNKVDSQYTVKYKGIDWTTTWLKKIELDTKSESDIQKEDQAVLQLFSSVYENKAKQSCSDRN